MVCVLHHLCLRRHKAHSRTQDSQNSRALKSWIGCAHRLYHSKQKATTHGLRVCSRTDCCAETPPKTQRLKNSQLTFLWIKGILGLHSPQSLLNTVFFCLRGILEHFNLKFSQLHRTNEPDDRYVYTKFG